MLNLKKKFNILNKLLFTLFLLFPAVATAAELEIAPFSSFNQSPLVQIFGLPHDTNAAIVPHGKLQFKLNQDLSSNYTTNKNSREQITLDGETYRAAVVVNYGVAPRFEVALDIPYLVIGGGALDRFVVDWHNTFNLPQGGRDVAANGQINYNYKKDGISRLQMNHSASGIGDITVAAGYSLYDSREADYADKLALRVGIKLPTGKSSDLLGSGGSDFLLQLCGSMDKYSEFGTIALYGSLGAVVMTNNHILNEQHNPLAGVATLGLGWSPSSWVSFKTQLNGNTALYHDSALAELSTDPVMLIVGGTIKLPNQYLLDIGVSEDLAVATAPDVSFHLGLNKKF